MSIFHFIKLNHTMVILLNIYSTFILIKLAYRLYHYLNDKYIEKFVKCKEENIHYINIYDYEPGFEKTNINIKKGDIIVWKNIGKHEQSVTDHGMKFDSGIMKSNQVYKLKFDYIGVYEFFSKPTNLHGRIIVQ